jgi:hypothetical protein
LSVVSLGSGQGDKDRILLKAFRQNGKKVSYLAVDTSRLLLELAVEGARSLRLSSKGLLADITKNSLPRLVRKRTKGPRLFLLLGNTLGGFDPIRLSRRLKRFLEPGDYLLVDGEIYAGRKTLAGYDHPANRRFAWGPLKGLGISEKDGQLRFEIRRDQRREGLYFIRKYFAPKKGKILEMSPSYKYLPNAFRALLKKETGIETIEEYWSRDRGLLMILGEKPTVLRRRSAR